MLEMLFNRIEKNEHVINVNNAKFKIWIEDVVHDSLKF